MKSLFNEDIPETVKPKPRGRFNIWKTENNYRKSSGEQKCKVCQHSERHRDRSKFFWKCRIMGISSSEASDIRAGHVCNRFKREELLCQNEKG